MANTERQELIILGGGVGGLVIASVAGQLGRKVTLIEKSGSLGGLSALRLRSQQDPDRDR